VGPWPVSTLTHGIRSASRNAPTSDVIGEGDSPLELFSESIVVMSNSERIALFIDGQNLHYAAKSLGFDVDFKRLLIEFQRRGTIVRSCYYITISENEDRSVRSLVDWLDYNGFTVLAKPTKEFDDGEGRRKIKRNIGVELAVDALEISDRIDHLVLFSGDGDLRALIEAVQRRGVRVTVVSTIRTRPPMVADELRRQADSFLELDDFKASIGRTMERIEQSKVDSPRTVRAKDAS
jgi:uncharacterized LabA/DUF88 family protein